MFRPYFDAHRTSITALSQYNDHLNKLKNMTKKTENEAPAIPGDTYVKPGKCEVDANRLGELEIENRQLIRRMNIIGRTKGKIDAELETQAAQTNFRTRQMEKAAIEKNNEEIHRIITTVESRYNKDEYLKDYQVLQRVIVEGSRYPEFYYERKERDKWSLFPANMNRSLLDPRQRVRCYFDIAVNDGIRLGKLEFEIWMDVAPIVGCNFLNLCKGYQGYSYKNTPFHIIFRELFCVGGDVVNQTGTGVYSVYGGINSTFGDENNTLEFNGPGVLAAHTVFAGENHSQFLITFRKLTTMNKQFVVFGRVVGSLRVLEMMESYGNVCGRPSKKLIIQNCGVRGNRTMTEPEHFVGELPAKISPQGSEKDLNILSVYDRICNRPPEDELERTIRTGIIKESRSQLKDRGFPAYKMDMPFIKKKLNCGEIFKRQLNKKKETVK